MNSTPENQKFSYEQNYLEDMKALSNLITTDFTVDANQIAEFVTLKTQELNINLKMLEEN